MFAGDRGAIEDGPLSHPALSAAPLLRDRLVGQCSFTPSPGEAMAQAVPLPREGEARPKRNT